MTGSEHSVRTTCPYCGVGCGVVARYRDDRLLAVSGDVHHAANLGRLCVKGSTLPDTQHGTGRLLHPHVGGERVSWSTAVDRVAGEFSRVAAEHGPGAVAMYLSGQLLTEDYYVANKLMKGFLGSSNVDTNSRLCMASAVAAHQRAFGEDVVPCDYEDLERCQLVVLVGSNAAWAHPVAFQRIEARRARGEVRVVVIDPRRTATCERADLHLALRPGTDAVLFNTLLVHLADTGRLDRRFIRQHTSGFEAALAAARADAVSASEMLGVSEHELRTFFDWFAATPRAVTVFSQGVNQASNGTDKANAIINCHLATGRIGAAGMGPFSITGQPNAMGGREVGGMANQLAAHADFAPAEVDRVARFWGAPNMARAPGLKAVGMFEAVARGDIRAIWILGTNPAVSLPRSDAVREALARCPFVVVSDCAARTDTTAYADVLLPAAGWGEKNGTVTNSERRISRQRGFLPPPGEAKPDWWAICQAARRLGFGAAFDYEGPAEIFAEHAALSGFENPGRLFDLGGLAGLSQDVYDSLEPVQWPLDATGPTRPFEDGSFRTADGRARFVAVHHREPVQQQDAAHPFVMNTGRLRDQWHTMTRTGASPRLFGHTDTPTIHLHEHDARRLGIATGNLVEARNRHGLVRAIAVAGTEVREGELFMPMHWNDRFAHPARVGALLDAVTDPLSGQPESKHGAVSLRRCNVGLWVRLVHTHPLCREPLDAHSLLWVRLPAEGGWRYELALRPESAADGWLDRLISLIPHHNAVEFTDPVNRQRRVLLEDREGSCRAGVFAAGHRDDLPAAGFLESLLRGRAELSGWRLLAGPRGANTDVSATVCTCFEVRENAIRAAMADGARTVQELGQRLRCGTNCGSCVPELNALLNATLHQGV